MNGVARTGVQGRAAWLGEQRAEPAQRGGRRPPLAEVARPAGLEHEARRPAGRVVPGWLGLPGVRLEAALGDGPDGDGAAGADGDDA